jgi:hypothetical protein
VIGNMVEEIAMRHLIHWDLDLHDRTLLTHRTVQINDFSFCLNNSNALTRLS